MGDQDVLIQVKYAGICGTDQHIFSGEFHPRTKLPMIPGHEFGGVIVETGKQVKKLKKDDLVAVDPIIWCGECGACKKGHYPACISLKLVGVDMDGGFGEYVAVRETMCYQMPENTDPKYAALVEVLGIGFHACNRAKVNAGDSVLIWGAGKVGNCILQAAKTKTDQHIILVDILDERLRKAKNAYPDVHTVNAKQGDPIEAIMSITQGRGVDVAFEAVGHAEAVSGAENPARGCINSIVGGGTVCVLGLADQEFPIVFKELIWKEGTIIASRVSHGEFAEVIDHMAKGGLKPDALVSSIFPMEHAQKAFQKLELQPEKELKILLENS